MNWKPSESIHERAVALIPKNDYMGTFESIPQFNRDFMLKNWGEPVGDISTDKGMIVIPGMVSGNVYVGFQPMRAASEQMDAMYHDPEMSMPHQYLAFYRWLENDFGADAIIHIGTHGTLEWLPGKNVGLSNKCFPDIVQNGMLDIYPYIIDDPGEGIQAKRRAEAVLIGHMCPTMARAGSYDSLSKVEVPLQEFYKSKLSMTEDRKTLLVTQILNACRECSLLEDLGISESGLDKLISASYRTLGLMSFLTAGEDECRAWTIRIGTKAPQAAGKIHSDFERGFIKAEVVNYEVLLREGSLAAAREKGLVGMEGKEYVDRDGDVILFRFNV
jgi:cobalamin biosynthesis Mg chelatase CobN